MLQRSNMVDRSHCMSNISFDSREDKFAGLKRTLELADEFKRWVCPMAVERAEPVNGSVPTQRLKSD